MRHILIYLFIALGIFGLLGWYFARQDTLQPDIQKVTAEANAIKQTQRQVELLFDGMGEEGKNNFRTALQTELEGVAKVDAHDCLGSAEVQLNYAQRLLEGGCAVLLVEPVDSAAVEGLIELTAQYDVPMILLNTRATTAWTEKYDKLYSLMSMEDTEEQDLERLADTIAYYWSNNRDALDHWIQNDSLAIAAVTEYGFEDSGKWDKLQSLLEQRDCTATLAKDIVTEYLNFNLEFSLDAIYYSGAEIILFSDSADAEKAYAYYNDPTEYSNGYDSWLCVMEADATAYRLYEQGRILFAEGSSGHVMGKAAAQLVTALLNEEQPRIASQLATPADSGKTFLCNAVVLRNMIETDEPEDDAEANQEANYSIS